MPSPPPSSTLFPYTTLFRSRDGRRPPDRRGRRLVRHGRDPGRDECCDRTDRAPLGDPASRQDPGGRRHRAGRRVDPSEGSARARRRSRRLAGLRRRKAGDAPAPPAPPLATNHGYGERPTWEVGRPHIHPLRVLLAWAVSGVALVVAAGVVPGASVRDFKAALAAAAAIAILNAILPPLVAAARLPFMAPAGFLVVLVLAGVMLLAADHITEGHVPS